MSKPQIISSSTCSKLFSTVVISDTQRKAQEKWLDLLQNGKLEKEKENYPVFMNTILRDLLEFPEELIEKAYEQKNVEFAFKDPQGQWAALFEAKGHSTKDLFANQGRIKKNQQTPIKQTFDNLGRFEFIKYGVCTNYQKFILMDYNLKFTALQEFDFNSTKNNDEKLKEFIGIFSYKTLVINKDISKFKKKSDDADKELSTEFYKLFHETRLMLIKSFKEKEGVTDSEAMYYTQRFLERILFLFFALDNGLINNSKLFTDRILNQLKLQQCTEDSTKIFMDIKLIFNALDKGSPVLGIDGFGGELFSGKFPEKIYFLDFQSKLFFANEIMNSKLSKELKLHGNAAEIWKEFGKDVNPIIRNLLIMDSRDFNSELNVTILGHILEQSLDDLTEFEKTGDVKRKINGVYYTPSTLTDYICRNTIIPYLSKSNTNDVHDLISEYQNDISELEDKLKKIKIIDPACGSGAFLINAAQILLEITEAIAIIKKPETSQEILGTLDVWQKDIEASKIIKNNIFGIDVNSESVEITKLSLFLMMAKPGEKLKNLSQNIIRRNSLVDDKEVDSDAIDWQKDFTEIMNSGGFDIVIGNPPWEVLSPDVDEFFSPKKEMKLLILTKFGKSIPFSKLKAGDKKNLMEKCLENNKLQDLYNKYKENIEKKLKFVTNPNNYKLQGDGGGNLYKLFVEKSFSIISKDGIFGMVLPTGIYSDLGGKEIRQLLFDKTKISILCGFTNTKPIFESGVDTRYKFCILITKNNSSTQNFPARFMVKDDDELHTFLNDAFDYDLNLIKHTSPDDLIIIECSSEKEYKLWEKFFKFPFLGSNVSAIKPTRELDMSKDSDLFHTADVGPLLFEGKMMNQFTDNFNERIEHRYWLDKDDVENRLKQKERNRIPTSFHKLNPEFEVKLHAHYYRLAYRQNTNPTNERTLISTVLYPNVFLGHNLHYIRPIFFDGEKYVHPISYQETLYLCGMFNSFCIDFIIRHKVGGNVSYYHINSLPIPRFDEENIFHQKIFKNSSKLICVTDEFAKLREDVGIPEFVTEPDKRLALEAQINACAAKIYDLTRDELEYVLGSFPSANKKLKDLTLDEFSLL